jgi:hypothetical protein
MFLRWIRKAKKGTMESRNCVITDGRESDSVTRDACRRYHDAMLKQNKALEASLEELRPVAAWCMETLPQQERGRKKGKSHNPGCHVTYQEDREKFLRTVEELTHTRSAMNEMADDFQNNSAIYKEHGSYKSDSLSYGLVLRTANPVA